MLHKCNFTDARRIFFTSVLYIWKGNKRRSSTVKSFGFAVVSVCVYNNILRITTCFYLKKISRWGGGHPLPHPTPSAPSAPRLSRLPRSTSAPLAPRSSHLVRQTLLTQLKNTSRASAVECFSPWPICLFIMRYHRSISPVHHSIVIKPVFYL